MASYDSDSSAGGDQDYTETDVLLGYPSKDPQDETISRLGGRPEWLDPSKPPSAALAKCKSCKDLMVLLLQLNGELPERFPGHERRLYVFSCKRKSCRRKEGSVRVLRGIRVNAEAASEKPPKEAKKEDKPAPSAPVAPPTGLGEALFGVKPAAGATAAGVNPFSTSSPLNNNANPFATKSSALGQANPFTKPATATAPATATTTPPQPAKTETLNQPDKEMSTLPKTFAETLSLNNPQIASSAPPPPEPWPAESDQPTPYPTSWLSEAEYETLDPTPAPRIPPSTGTMMDIDSADTAGSSSSGGKEDKEVFESTMDATFQRFADRVGQNPDQCLRYEFAGQPLLYSKTDAVGRLLLGATSATAVTVGGGAGVGGGVVLPRCGNCGAGRVFEMQLTPRAIEELEREEDGLEGMDWGTVIVGVCERDCTERGQPVGDTGYVEEWVGVQWEELTVRR